jgi:predicted nucleic acid-binding protein
MKSEREASLVYFDAAIWISFILKESGRYDHAKDELERLNRGDTAIVSTLVMLEVISVIRQRVTQAERFVGINSGAKDSIIKKVDTKINEFVGHIIQLEKQGKIKITNPDMKIDPFFTSALTILQNHKGDLKEFNYCFICKRNILPSYKFSGLGHFDIMHALNAMECSVKELVTFDEAFNQLPAIPQFGTITPKVISKKRSKSSSSDSP